MDFKVGKKTLKLEKDSKIIKNLCVYCLLVLPSYGSRLPNHTSTIRYPIFGRNKMPFSKSGLALYCTHPFNYPSVTNLWWTRCCLNPSQITKLVWRSSSTSLRSVIFLVLNLDRSFLVNRFLFDFGGPFQNDFCVI